MSQLISLFGNTTWVEREIRYAINEIYARKGYDFTRGLATRDILQRKAGITRLSANR